MSPARQEPRSPNGFGRQEDHAEHYWLEMYPALPTRFHLVDNVVG